MQHQTKSQRALPLANLEGTYELGKTRNQQHERSASGLILPSDTRSAEYDLNIEYSRSPICRRFE